MLKQLVATACAVVLLSGCAGKKGMNSCVDSSLVSEFEHKVGDRVHFATDRSLLTKEAHHILERQVAWLKEHPKLAITIEGHCDERGTREYNLALGERRAAAAAKFMEQHGLSKHMIETVSYGKERPVELGNTQEAYAKNRRAVTVLRNHH